MSLPRVTTPRTDRGSYIVSRMDGEIITLPGLMGAFRFYASQKQTDDKMTVFGWDGPFSDTQGFHHHKITHDCFLLTEGTMKVWCKDQCRIMGPGDFAYVPPNILHKPLPLGPITKVMPLITPAHWVDFFRAFADPFDGLMFNEHDNQDILKALNERLGVDAAGDRYDNYPEIVENPAEPTPWTEADEILPDGCEPYYLKWNKGPKWLLGGVSSRPFVTTKQSQGKFAISSIESSSIYGSSAFSRQMSFSNTHHCLVLLDGIISFKLGNDEPTEAYAGDVVFITNGQPFSFEFKTKYCRFWSYTSGDGVEAVIHEAGVLDKNVALPDKALAIDEAKIADVCHKLRVKLV